LIPDCGEVAEQNQFAVFSLFVDHRAGRHFKDQIVAVGAGAVGTLPVYAPLAVELGVEAVIDEGVLVEGGNQVD